METRRSGSVTVEIRIEASCYHVRVASGPMTTVDTPEGPRNAPDVLDGYARRAVTEAIRAGHISRSDVEWGAFGHLRIERPSDQRIWRADALLSRLGVVG